MQLLLLLENLASWPLTDEQENTLAEKNYENCFKCLKYQNSKMFLVFGVYRNYLSNHLMTLVIRIFPNGFLHENVLYNGQVGYGALTQNEMKKLILNNARWLKLLHSCWVLLHPIPSFIFKTLKKVLVIKFRLTKIFVSPKETQPTQKERETQFVSTNIF